MKSALFVDFDNVYTQLNALQPEAADRFARNPIEWINWMVDALALPSPHLPESRRRILVRRCYLNPVWYQRYRTGFLRAGFEIVDCPPVTSQGKTSTDIHMVLDIVELLQHEAHYEEFIVLSADADFTPVLRKLRRFDRRTTVLAIGYPSAAYQASADLMIDERRFIDEALGLGGDEVDDAEEVEALKANPLEAPIPIAPIRVEHEPKPAVCRLDQRELVEASAIIRAAVSAAAKPVPAAQLALRLRSAFPQRLVADWNGSENFKAFFFALKIEPLVWITGSGGRIADPGKHVVNPEGIEPSTTSAWTDYAHLLTIAREASQLTGAPLLAPPDVRRVITALSEDLQEEPFDVGETALRVHLACEQHYRAVEFSRRDIMFILRGLQLNGHRFGRGQDDVTTLSRRYFNQVLFLCQREQMVVDARVIAQIEEWIVGDLALSSPTEVEQHERVLPDA